MEHMARNKSNMNVNEQQIKNTTSDNNKKAMRVPSSTVVTRVSFTGV
jgi:hypothetical protein